MTKESNSLAAMAAKFNTVPETLLDDAPAAKAAGKRGPGRPRKPVRERKVTLVMPQDVFGAMVKEALARKVSGADGASNSAVVADALRSYCRKHFKDDPAG